MKTGVILLIKTVVVLLLCFIGVFGVHFMFVMGVDASKERALLKQCEAYAEENQVEFIEAMNSFTYEEKPNHAVCKIKDLYDKLVFIDPELSELEYRNAKSYQLLDAFDPADKNQSLTLSLHQGQPVYVFKNIEADRIYVAYYSFDTRSLLFAVDSEE